MRPCGYDVLRLTASSLSAQSLRLLQPSVGVQQALATGCLSRGWRNAGQLPGIIPMIDRDIGPDWVAFVLSVLVLLAILGVWAVIWNPSRFSPVLDSVGNCGVYQRHASYSSLQIDSHSRHADSLRLFCW